MRRHHLMLTRACATMAVAVLYAPAAFASGTGMPWETPLQNVLDSITGPVAKAAGIIAIVLAGLGFAFGESGGLMRKVMGIIFGLAIAFAAAQWGMTFFGFAGGAGF
jgi:type IV secretory pathway VirB2 component (pilin)